MFSQEIKIKEGQWQFLSLCILDGISWDKEGPEGISSAEYQTPSTNTRNVRDSQNKRSQGFSIIERL